MQRQSRTRVLSVVFGLLLSLVAPTGATVDASTAPLIGVRAGGRSHGPDDVAAHERWLDPITGMQKVGMGMFGVSYEAILGALTVDGSDPSATSEIERELSRWSTYVPAVLIHVPMLPGCQPAVGPRNPSPYAGCPPPQDGPPLGAVLDYSQLSAELAEGAGTLQADGTYAGPGRWDQHYRALGDALAAQGFQDAYIRVGREAEGDWYRHQYGPNAAAWKQFWRNIVTSMRNGDPSRFKFVWNMGIRAWTRNGATSDPTSHYVGLGKAYPGDDVVDVVGPDFYDGVFCQYGPPGYQPSASEQEAKWDSIYLTSNPNNYQFGLDWWANFVTVRGHAKPVAFPEWGVSPVTDPVTGGSRCGGGDNPFFISKMAEWVFSPPQGVQVAFIDYFDYSFSRLSPEDETHNALPSQWRFPKAGCAYLTHFWYAGAPTPYCRLFVAS